MSAAPARRIAYHVLHEIETKQAYAHVTLYEALAKTPLSVNDSALVSEIVHGVLVWRRLIDSWITSLTRGGTSAIQPAVMVILRMALYQLRFLDRVPAYAVISDAVDLAKQHAARATGFVNAVMRAAQREAQYERPLEYSELAGVTLAQAALRLSYPDWLAAHLAHTLGEELALETMWAFNQKAHRTLRVNTTRCSREELLARLRSEGVAADPSPVVPEGIRLGPRIAPTTLRAYREGLCTLQGESSMLIAHLLQASPGMAILDACAAPGGKATHVAELTGDAADVTAVDIHAHRVEMISAQAQRLGLASIRAVNANAQELTGTFDRVLLDVPCSGLGTIHRKPDLKWTMKPEKLVALIRSQAELLNAAAAYVRQGGVLLYTTCTLSDGENEEQIAGFLMRNEDFSLTDFTAELPFELCQRNQQTPGMARILPQDFGGDGFFIARLRRT